MPTDLDAARRPDGEAVANIRGDFVRVWDIDLVDCRPLHDDAFWALRRSIERGYDKDLGTGRPCGQQIIDGAPTGADDLHRYLLDVQKRVRTDAEYSMREDIAWALDRVREHSRLYTPRTCLCVRQAFMAFIVALDVDLEPLRRELSEAGAAPYYACSSPSGVHTDHEGAVTAQSLLPYAGARHGTFSDRMPPRIRVARIGSALEVSTGTRRRTAAWHTCRFTFVPQPLQQVAHAVSWSADRTYYNRSVASWVLSWDGPFTAVVQAWVAAGHRGLDPVRDLQLANLPALSSEGQAILARLAPGWSGSLVDLVLTSTAMSAPALAG